MGRNLLTKKMVAKRLCVTPRTISTYIKDGRFEVAKVKGKVLVYEDSVDKAISEATK